MLRNTSPFDVYFPYVRNQALVSSVRHARRRGHRDRCVQYTHQMSDADADTSARTLARIVPLIYGGLLGGLIENIPVGVAMGMLLTVALDLRMGNKSMMLNLLRPLIHCSCRLLQRGYPV